MTTFRCLVSIFSFPGEVVSFYEYSYLKSDHCSHKSAFSPDSGAHDTRNCLSASVKDERRWILPSDSIRLLDSISPSLKTQNNEGCFRRDRVPDDFD